MALSTGSGTGTQQGSTDSPQSATSGGNFGGTAASGVQPGTATSLLNSSGTSGVPLGSSDLTQVSLNGASDSQSAPGNTVATQPPPTNHHANPVMLGFVSLVFLVAAYLFWVVSRSAKNTTDY